MLDLKVLEEKLDKALEAETKESLTEWLLSKRDELSDKQLSVLNKPLTEPIRFHAKKEDCG